MAEAIDYYTKAQAAVPLPDYSAALEDLYEAAGKPEEARKQAARLAVIERMDQAAGFAANRNLALAYADHGRNLDHALAMIQEEMKTRRDIYEHDALAWVLYQSRQYAEARQASEKALELHTPEPGFYYHAGMIARAGRSRGCAQASGTRARVEREFRSEAGRGGAGGIVQGEIGRASRGVEMTAADDSADRDHARYRATVAQRNDAVMRCADSAPRKWSERCGGRSPIRWFAPARRGICARRARRTL